MYLRERQGILVGLTRWCLHVLLNVPGVVSLLEQGNTSPVTRYIAIDLANSFFSIPVNNVYQKQLAKLAMQLHCSGS